MILLIIFLAIVSFLTTILLLPRFILYLKGIDLIVKDMNKKNTPLVPISGGIVVFFGIFIGIMLFIFIDTFIYHNTLGLIELLAATLSILTITLIGFIDDILINKNKERSIGLKQWQKPLLVLPAAIPLMVINAGVTKIYLPILHEVNLGLIYPLFLIPIAVIGAGNMVNLLAGFNGSETGMALVYSAMLGIFAYTRSETLAAIISFIVFGALLAFFIFNKYPAKILPGDSLTYLLGAYLAVIAIIGNLEKAALIISIPFFIEFFLKLRGKFKPQSYGYFYNGNVKSYYKKIYSIPHILTITGKFTEKEVSYFLILTSLFFSSLIWIL